MSIEKGKVYRLVEKEHNVSPGDTPRQFLIKVLDINYETDFIKYDEYMLDHPETLSYYERTKIYLEYQPQNLESLYDFTEVSEASWGTARLLGSWDGDVL